MALVDPYAPCPCGSGQKFKWCCIKVEPYAERARKLMDNGRLDGALAAIEEGLARFADSPWLLIEQSSILNELGRSEEAKAAALRIVEKHPNHPNGLAMLTRLAMDNETPASAALQFQEVLRKTPPADRSRLAILLNYLGFSLQDAGFSAAGLKHLELMRKTIDARPGYADRVIGVLESSRTVPLWEKNPYRLAPPPDGLPQPARETFDRALDLAEQGLWADAAGLFQELSAAGAAGPVADRNLGLCRLWLADNPGAVEALRRYIVKTPPSVDAVDLECLCQALADPPAGEQIEFIRQSWKIRNHDGLIEALQQAPKVVYSGRKSDDPEDEEAPAVEEFSLLDRPRIEARPGLTPGDVPLIMGTVIVADDHVHLDAYDDGRLDALTDQFTTLAGRNIPPAHPKTKVVGKVDKSSLALVWNWAIPEELPEAEADRLNHEQGAHVIRDVWPDAPAPYLHRRTPRQVAGHPNAEVPLRAVLLQFRIGSKESADLVDWDRLRNELKIPPEPEVDPSTVDVEELHLARLDFVPCDRLDDDRLAALYRRAARYGRHEAVHRACLAIVDRPGFCARSRIPPSEIFGDLALRSARDGNRDEAMEWLRRGRAEEPPSSHAAQAVVWEMFELQARMMLDKVEDWVPELASLLDRYADEPAGAQIVHRWLISLGLLRPVRDPDRPGETLFDPSPLQNLLRLYGPRITTSSGYLGVSASRGEIWTPGSGAGGSAIWTPGSGAPDPGAAPEADRPRLILPGQ